MLTLTENASTAVKTITEQVGTDTGGIRITGGAGSDFSLAVVEAPVIGDQVVESAGARVFLEEPTAVLLDESILDAQADDSGAVRFALARQG